MVCNYIIEIKNDNTFDLYLDNKLMKLTTMESEIKGEKFQFHIITNESFKISSLISFITKKDYLYIIGNVITCNKKDNKIYGTITDSDLELYDIKYDDNVQRSSPDGGVELQANGSGKILDLYNHYRYDI